MLEKGRSEKLAGRQGGDVCEPSWAQILVAFEASGQVVQGQNAAIAVYVILLRTDLRAATERSVATEKQVSIMQTNLDALKVTVATLVAKTRKLEMRVEDVEGRSCRCNLRVVGFPEGVEGTTPEVVWIKKALPTIHLSSDFVEGT
ncbi:hypothetical protein NDU88_003002 [Pleurodeles waltl]|uniref:Uncharacterized protein n=1 Tax=Pleurodeles waltl TaxID=8319 RepID=A0AAV7NFD0_PLEWA|nr:hypothetical protein NDU88_003002 [Pleurodeles waltl]